MHINVATCISKGVREENKAFQAEDHADHVF